MDIWLLQLAHPGRLLTRSFAVQAQAVTESQAGGSDVDASRNSRAGQALLARRHLRLSSQPEHGMRPASHLAMVSTTQRTGVDGSYVVARRREVFRYGLPAQITLSRRDTGYNQHHLLP